MSQFVRSLVILSSLLLSLSCESNPKRDTDSVPKPLRFIDAVEIPYGETQDGFKVGGLSSLYYDNDSSQLISISDDTSVTGTARFHYFTLAVSEDVLSVVSQSAIPLLNEQGGSFQPEETIDAEAFDRLANGNWIVSSEGIKLNDRFTIPQLLEFDPSGKLVKRWPFPDHYMIKEEKSPETGIRSNAAFEGLHLTPEKDSVIMAAEKALYQDGPVSTYEATSMVRIMRKDLGDEGYGQAEEFLYELSAIPALTDDESIFALIGISDIMVISANELLVVERSFIASPVNINTVQIFLVTLPTLSADERASSKRYPVKVEKTLWVDLDDYRSVDGFPDIDNVEGIILGPTLDNGNQTLIVVSDNNFSPRQQTLFYAFEVLEAL